MIDVTVVLLGNGHGSTAVGPIEVFGSTGVLWNLATGQDAKPLFNVRTATINGQPVTPDGAAYTLAPTARLADVRKTDLVIVPSIGLDIEGALKANKPLVGWLERQYANGAKVAGICSGVCFLAEAGILDGKRATTHWALADTMKALYPAAKWDTDLLVTEDDGVYCSGGVYAAIDLSLYLVEKLTERTLAVECAKALLLNMPRPTQAGFGVLPIGAEHADAAIHEAEEWLAGHFHEDFRFEDLAKERGMSPRNFIRRFKAATHETPLSYLQKLRIATAKRMLEEDFRNVQDISYAVGYEDVTFFRKIFRRHTGFAPKDYRSRFGRAA